MSAAEKLGKRDILNFIELRQAEQGDDSKVGELLVESFSATNYIKLNGYELNRARRDELSDVRSRRLSGLVWVIELGKQVIGSYAILKPDSPISDAWVPKFPTLRCLAIERRFQGLGFSSLMINHAEGVSKSWGLNGICLHVQKGAFGLERLYQKHGYRRDARGDDKFLGAEVRGFIKVFDLNKQFVAVKEENIR